MDSIYQTSMGFELANIYQILIHLEKDRDRLIWPHNVSREASTKVVYVKLREIVIPSTTINGLIAQSSRLKL